MTRTQRAQRFGGQPIDWTAGELPLHCITLGHGVTYQFPDAASLVAFARSNYDAHKRARA